MPQHDQPRPGPVDSADWSENPRWQAAMGKMQKLSRALPGSPLADEDWAVPAAQNVAQLIVEVEDRLSEDELAVLYGVGALFVREGMKEMGALIDAWRALGMVRTIRPDSEGQADG
jgi:hypothetical protein